MGVPKKTHAQYENELLEREIDYFPLEEYKGTDTLILHECLNGHVWRVTPHNILKGRGCPECSSIRKHTTEEYQSRIPHKVLEPYVNNRTAILHECVIGHTWKARPDSILAGTGCPDCNKVGGYNSTRFANDKTLANSPGILYCVVLVNKSTSERVCLKIGITKGTSNKAVLKRSQGFTGYEARIQKLVFGTLEQVFNLEQELHSKWAHKRYKSEWKFGGYSELFELEADIIRSIPSSV